MLTRGGAPQYGKTVLHAAAWMRRLEVVRFLVEELGVDVSVEDAVTSRTLLPLSKSPELSALCHSLPFAGHPPPSVHPPTAVRGRRVLDAGQGMGEGRNSGGSDSLRRSHKHPPGLNACFLAPTEDALQLIRTRMHGLIWRGCFCTQCAFGVVGVSLGAWAALTDLEHPKKDILATCP